MRFLLLLFLCSCATAKVVGPPIVVTPDPKIPRVVVIEPFFENAEWKTEVVRFQGTPGMMGSGMPVGSGVGSGVGVGVGMGFGGGRTGPTGGVMNSTDVVTITKPLLTQVDSLAAEHRQVLQFVQQLRPDWRVTSTSGLQALEGEVTVVRVIVETNEIIGTDRPLHNAAFGFGIILWPLQIYNGWPVVETERAYGALERYLTDPATVKSRLVRYKTQPDSAFNASGFTPLRRDFGLDMTYEEGLLANEAPRKDVLIEAFSQRLASAIVAIVEEPR